jgi:hypothetical protein
LPITGLMRSVVYKPFSIAQLLAAIARVAPGPLE